MPTLNEHKSKSANRILIVGDPSTGKTTAIGHLLSHGQRLFVADFDDGLDPIRHFVDPSFHNQLVYETLVDKVRPHPQTGYPVTPRAGDGHEKPTAFRRFIKLMDQWRDGDNDYGKPEDWDNDCWLVIDSLTALGNATMLYTLSQNNKMSAKNIRKKDWGDAIRRVEGVPMLLRSLPINIIMTAHLMRLTFDDGEDDEEEEKKVKPSPGQPQPKAFQKRKKKVPDNLMMRYPTTLGQKLPPRIAGYFNVILQTKTVGSGARAGKILSTVPDEDVDVKVPVPLGKNVEVPITGLYDIIQSIRETGGSNGRPERPAERATG